MFDSYQGVDSLLHVDPAHLRSKRIPELLGSYKRFQNYFGRILDLIAAAKPGDALGRQAVKSLIFPEVREAALGYAEASNAGHGVKHGVFLLIKVGEHEKKLKHIVKVHHALKKERKSVPDLMVIDATEKLSASKLKGFFDF